jgi:hypothetical protein
VAREYGSQVATTRLLPPGTPDASGVALAGKLGLRLYPWQQEVLSESARTDAEGRWSAFENVVMVPRQNGKSFFVIARVLAGALIYGERLLLYSAHEYRTAQELWLTLLEMIRSEPLSRYVTRIYTSAGREAVEFTTGARFRLVARTRASTRGMFPDCVFIDEAFAVSAEVIASVIPSLAARPNPQIYYLSSAGTWESLVLFGLRQRGHKGSSAQLAYWEWHADPADDPSDPKVWLATNPSLGHLITMGAVRRELESMSRKAFLRERCGVWTESTVDSVLAEDDVMRLVVPMPEPPTDGRPVTWGLDVAHDRTGAAIVAAFHGDDGAPVVVLVDARAGAGWVPSRLAELMESRGLYEIAYDGGGGLADIAEWAEREYQVSPAPLRHVDYPVACAAMVQRVSDRTMRFGKAPALIGDAISAIARTTRTGWMWDRKTATPPTHLIAATCALYALENAGGGIGVY